MTEPADTDRAATGQMATGIRGEEFRTIAKVGLAPARIKELTRLSAARSTLAVGQTFAIIAATAAATQVWPHPLSYAMAIIVMAGQQHALAILAHEAVHYRLYGARWLNDAVGGLCGYLISVSMLSYRVVHRLHHNHLYEPADPDLPLQAGYPRGRAYLAKRLIRDALGLTTFKNYAYFFGRPGINTADGLQTSRKALDDTSPRLRDAARRDRTGVIAFQIVLLASAVAGGWWREYLLLWLLPLVTVLQAILRFRALCEHGAVPDTSQQRLATRTTLAPWWIRWLLLPHHVNYHLEHHLYPAVPHYRLRECHREMRAAGMLEGTEVATLAEATRKFFADPAPPAAAE